MLSDMILGILRCAAVLGVVLFASWVHDPATARKFDHRNSKTTSSSEKWRNSHAGNYRNG